MTVSGRSRMVWHMRPWLCFLCGLLFAAPLAAQQEDDPELDSEDAPEAGAEPAGHVATAGEEDYWAALRLLEEPTETAQQQGRDLLEKSVEAEFSHAQNFYGGCLLSGSYGFKKSPRRAAQFFRLAAARGNAYAQVNLGRAYLLGQGVWKNEKKAREWLERAVAAEADYSVPPPPEWLWEFFAAKEAEAETIALDEPPTDVATRMLGHFLLGTLDQDEESFTSAQEHFLAAAEAGPMGRYGLGDAALAAAMNCAFGQGTPRDLARADALLERSHHLSLQQSTGFVHSLTDRRFFDRFLRADIAEEMQKLLEKRRIDLQVGIADQLSDDGEEHFDPAEAIKWYTLAAEQGKRPWAMLKIAFLYAKGVGGAPDMEKAAEWFRRAGEEGHHHLGYANYMICLYRGLGVPQDREAALALAETYASRHFTCYLATLGIVPDSIVTYDEELKTLQRRAKKDKDPHAEYLLGRRYRYGWGVDYDRDKANKWFTRAMEQGHGGASYELGYAFDHGYGFYQDRDQAFALFEQSLRRGFEDAAFELGYYVSIHGYEADLNLVEAGPRTTDQTEQAVFFYERYLHANPESGNAWNNLGSQHKSLAKRAETAGDATALELNRKRMLECFEKAADLDEEYAHYNLGLLYLEGDLVEKDERRAFREFRAAADGGHVVSHRYVARMLRDGIGVTASEEESIHYYRLLALEEDTDRTDRLEALDHLSRFYLSGGAGLVDFDVAEFWVRLYAYYGSYAALNGLGDLMLQTERYSDARKFFSRLLDHDADLVRRHAYFRLYEIYHRGLGVRVREKKAERYFEKALELRDEKALLEQGRRASEAGDMAAASGWWDQATLEGSAEAAFCLGCLLHAGDGVPQDVKKAYAFFRLSARGGYVQALFSLAVSAYKEMPEAPTLEEGLEFARQAEEAGHPKAAALRRMIEKKLEQTRREAPTVGTGQGGTA